MVTFHIANIVTLIVLILLYSVDKKKFYGAMELKEEAVRMRGMGVPCDGNS